MGKALNLGKLAVKARPSHWEQQAAAMPSHSTLMLSPVAVSSTACRTLPIPFLFAKPAISGKLKQASPRKAEATAKSKQEQRLGCQSFAQRWLKKSIATMDLELCMSQTGTEQGPESVSALLPYMPGRRVDARSRTGWNEGKPRDRKPKRLALVPL